jgi:hypothetical protein
LVQSFKNSPEKVTNGFGEALVTILIVGGLGQIPNLTTKTAYNVFSRAFNRCKHVANQKNISFQKIFIMGMTKSKFGSDIDEPLQSCG